MIDPTINAQNWQQLVMAIGGLGTAAYGVVDATKALGGGVSQVGFRDIRKVISKLIPVASESAGNSSALMLDSALATLRANWMNGMAMADQKSVAKALVKLNLTPEFAAKLAAATGVNADMLKSVAMKLSAKDNAPDAGKNRDKLTDQETDVYGRFDLLLSSLLDQAYQRGDQRYRNSAKLAAVVVSLVLAWWGTYMVLGPGHFQFATVAGILATPLAPVAKDLASTIQAGAKIAQLWKK